MVLPHPYNPGNSVNHPNFRPRISRSSCSLTNSFQSVVRKGDDTHEFCKLSRHHAHFDPADLLQTDKTLLEIVSSSGFP